MGGRASATCSAGPGVAGLLLRCRHRPL